MGTFDFSELPVKEKILTYLRDDPWFKDGVLKRLTVELSQLKDAMDAFDKTRLHITQKTTALLERFQTILDLFEAQKKEAHLAQVRQEALLLKQRLLPLYHEFLNGPFRKFSNTETVISAEETALLKMRESTICRFRKTIEPGTKGCLDILDRLVMGYRQPKLK